MGIRINMSELPDGEHKGNGEVFQFPSKSSPGQVHITTALPTGIICSCMGFTTHRNCWHVREVAELMENRDATEPDISDPVVDQTEDPVDPFEGMPGYDRPV